MGCYINPEGLSKEAWLISHGRSIATPVIGCGDTLSEFQPGFLPVCLVDNGPFTAAAVAYSDRELQEFIHKDGRPKQWFLVPIEALKTVSPLNDYLL